MKKFPFISFTIAAILNAIIIFQPWDSYTSTVFSFFSIAMIGIGIYQLRCQTKLNAGTTTGPAFKPEYDSILKEQEKFLQSMRQQRHDWLNHFQVLLGNLKLQRYDVCEEYIKKVTENTNNDSRIAGLGWQPLAAYLLTFNALHKELSLEVELPAAIDLSQFTEQNCRQIYELISGIVEIYRTNAMHGEGEWNTLVLLLQIVNDKIYISIEFEGDLKASETLAQLHLLADNLGNEEGFFVEGLHNNRESIMEFYVPLSVKS